MSENTYLMGAIVFMSLYCFFWSIFYLQDVEEFEHVLFPLILGAFLSIIWPGTLFFGSFILMGLLFRKFLNSRKPKNIHVS